MVSGGFRCSPAALAKRQATCLILICSVALDLTVEGTGRATWKRRLLARGVEADASYYVRNAKLPFQNRELDIEVDPPPDFVVEIDLTNDSRRKFSVYAALGVPEIWRYDGSDLQFLRLVDGQYAQSPDSLSFPGLSSALFIEATSAVECPAMPLAEFPPIIGPSQSPEMRSDSREKSRGEEWL